MNIPPPIIMPAGTVGGSGRDSTSRPGGIVRGSTMAGALPCIETP